MVLNTLTSEDANVLALTIKEQCKNVVDVLKRLRFRPILQSLMHTLKPVPLAKEYKSLQASYYCTQFFNDSNCFPQPRKRIDF